MASDFSHKNVDRYHSPCNFTWEFENSFDCGKGNGGGSFEPNDILPVLPVDPFGMGVVDSFGMGVTTSFAAITGWVESSKGFSNFGSSGLECDTDEFQIFWNRALKVHEEQNLVNWYTSDCKTDEFKSCYNGYSSQTVKESCNGNFSKGDGGVPHDALFFALRYLDVEDLLCVERVCRSLRAAVRNDVLLWKDIQIDYPLSARISDGDLLRLAKRAQGNLMCLSLVQCSRISDDGLKQVLESNLKLTKLNVTGCTRLSVDGMINSLKVSKSLGASGIKHLRIGGRYGLKPERYEELKSLVGADMCIEPKSFRPRFYHHGQSSLTCDDDRNIDIEICPRCNNLALIYDCPPEKCKGCTPPCRACITCIARCTKCGRCINNSDYVENFCLELLCLDCWFPDGHEQIGAHSKHTIFQHGTTFCVRFYG